ncbi:hypothetical protein [Parasitella parasitica]|uniref:Arrestin C-terminal-like domain-containing protein n=1 Tax=Parasitella parasitica TaxID=35722 RepID=A0A0B7NMX1_9FUNG|nr:hypothetical protein [Parasitella parasitica]
MPFNRLHPPEFEKIRRYPAHCRRIQRLHRRLRRQSPADKRPSTSRDALKQPEIPKVAKISYILTATHKKPMFKFSHALSSATQEIKILDMINVLLPDYRMPVKMSNDIGFLNGSKLSQWCLSLARSAFTRGENIKLECQINHFPIMEKAKAIKVSLMRQVYKTSSAKVLENKVLSSTTLDINTTDKSPSQSLPVELHVPYDTPPSIFPDSGRTLSVSYVIQAELKMKGVKSAIKLKPVYKQEVTIVIGTFSIDSMPPTHDNNPPQKPLHTPASVPSTSLPMHRKSTTDLMPIRRKSTAQSPVPVPAQVSFSKFDNMVKPLPRLEKVAHRKSYGNTASKSLSSPTPSASPSPTPSYSMRVTSNQHEFDDYIPATPLRRLSLSSARSSTSTAVTDRSLTPLPSMKAVQVNPYSTVSYLNRKNAPRPSLLSMQTPNEIGPNDITTKQGIPVAAAAVETSSGLSFNAKALDAGGEDENGSSIPELLSRHDTISTASSSGIMDPLHVISTAKPSVDVTPIDRASNVQ